jgi:hypothetical protein
MFFENQDIYIYIYMYWSLLYLMTFNLHLSVEWGIVDGKAKQGNIQRYFMRREALIVCTPAYCFLQNSRINI